MRRWLIGGVLLSFMIGCSKSEEPPAASPTVRASITVTDLEGAPLAGMLPIATADANAFQAPDVRGNPTDSAGKGTLDLPRDRRLFVRAWDPNLQFFAANFFDIPPSTSGDATENMTIAMAQGSALDVTWSWPDGTPVGQETVTLMMIHPERGPWWPDQTQTNRTGVALFPSLPPGEYSLRFDVGQKYTLELEKVLLIPGGKTELGTLTVGTNVQATK